MNINCKSIKILQKMGFRFKNIVSTLKDARAFKI